MIEVSEKTYPGVPSFIYGHSLGGGIVIDYLLRSNKLVKGAIVTSPWLRLAFEPSGLKRAMAGFMKKIFPGLTQPTGLDVSYISHDPNVINEYNNDPLVHDKISINLFNGAMQSGEYSMRHGADLKVPLLLLHGSDDKITSHTASRDFALNSSLVEIKIWDGGYHELHNEPFKKEVFEYILN